MFITSIQIKEKKRAWDILPLKYCNGSIGKDFIIEKLFPSLEIEVEDILAKLLKINEASTEI